MNIAVIDADLIGKGGIVQEEDSSLVPLSNGCICCLIFIELDIALFCLNYSLNQEKTKNEHSKFLFSFIELCFHSFFCCIYSFIA